jgi:hypothetical protein
MHHSFAGADVEFKWDGGSGNASCQLRLLWVDGSNGFGTKTYMNERSHVRMCVAWGAVMFFGGMYVHAFDWQTGCLNYFC